MRLITFNVNGIRAISGKGFFDFMAEIDPDMICLQETKIQGGQAEFDTPNHIQYWNYAERKGYSGTAIFTKTKPISEFYGMGIAEHDTEGRIITLEYEEFYLVTVYTPNSKDGLKRLDYRVVWEEAFREYICKLDEKKPVIVCGDLNVAHLEIDLKNPKTNRKNAGFTDEERGEFTKLLEAGFSDVFREFYPEEIGAYTWWSYRFNARANNSGWRIDYFVVSKRFMERVTKVEILNQVMGSDHCPVMIEIN